ncbi:hypothetical protein MML48_3g00016149 [Holotrichia oblita]|uniref:Uncharacterized protein n=1 Tax=Holotrichia oblita TaxID=644536 RepID=A0ACB9TCS9_HOLOL|nr:hypothetical protein MML48_3g00016149 [Holotrichia oblita]
MVVPIERVSSINKSKKIVGNNQTVEFKENSSTIKVIGNNCHIKIQENEGCLKVIGDCCRITVDSGRGCVNYIGNCGKIQLGEGVNESQVTYIGNGTEIMKFVQNSRDSVPLQKPVKIRKNSEKRKCVNLILWEERFQINHDIAANKEAKYPKLAQITGDSSAGLTRNDKSFDAGVKTYNHNFILVATSMTVIPYWMICMEWFKYPYARTIMMGLFWTLILGFNTDDEPTSYEHRFICLTQEDESNKKHKDEESQTEHLRAYSERMHRGFISSTFHVGSEKQRIHPTNNNDEINENHTSTADICEDDIQEEDETINTDEQQQEITKLTTSSTANLLTETARTCSPPNRKKRKRDILRTYHRSNSSSKETQTDPIESDEDSTTSVTCPLRGATPISEQIENKYADGNQTTNPLTDENQQLITVNQINRIAINDNFTAVCRDCLIGVTHASCRNFAENVPG